MQPSTVIPVTFENNEIQTNMDGLLVYHDVLSDRKIFNCKAIGFRTIQLSYLDTPGTYVFRSQSHHALDDPAFQCFGQVSNSTYDSIPKEQEVNGAEEENKYKKSETMMHDKDEFHIQSFVDTLHMGMGAYCARYLTRKLPHGYRGYAVACLNVEEGTWSHSDNLIKVLFFNEDCHMVKNLAVITDAEPELPPEEVDAVELSRQDKKRLAAQQQVMDSLK